MAPCRGLTDRGVEGDDDIAQERGRGAAAFTYRKGEDIGGRVQTPVPAVQPPHPEIPDQLDAQLGAWLADRCQNQFCGLDNQG